MKTPEEAIDLAGTYALLPSKRDQLVITPGPNGNLRVRIATAFEIDEPHEMILTDSTELNGLWQLRYNKDHRDDQFYLFSAQGHATALYRPQGDPYPAVIAITGFKTKDGGLDNITTYWAAAYEFQGNAESVNGQHAAWTKLPP